MRNNADKFTLEELVAVEEDVVRIPCSCGGKNTGSKICEAQLERLHIIASNAALLLGDLKLFAGRPHLEGTVVDKPQGANCRDCEGDAVGVLCSDL